MKIIYIGEIVQLWTHDISSMLKGIVSMRAKFDKFDMIWDCFVLFALCNSPGLER